MDEIIGFLLFIAVMGFSILSKRRADRKAAQDRETEPQKPATVEELPEPLRRMLFGDTEGEIIVAKPKEPPQMRRAYEESVTPAPSPVPARQVAFERPPTAAQPARVPAQKTFVNTAPWPGSRQQTRPAVQQRPRQAQQVRKQPHAKQPQPTTPATAQAKVQTQAQFEAVTLARHSTYKQGVPALLRSRSGLAQAIVLHEILGRPRAFDL